MDVDVIVVGGGLAGSTIATVLAQRGCRVLVLEREMKFKDRVRGENMLPWGAATARRLGVIDDLVAAGGHAVPFFNTYAMGARMEHRPLPETTPTREGCLNMYHPDLQETLLARAIGSGADVRRGVSVQGLSENGGRWTTTFVDNGESHSRTARLVIGADGRFSAMRNWGGFAVKRDPENLRIAGTIVQGTRVPDDGVHLCLGPGIATFVAPLGNNRARVYFIYVGAMGDRKLSGKDKVPAFLEACRATGAPGEWFDEVEVTARRRGGQPDGLFEYLALGHRHRGDPAAVRARQDFRADGRCRARHQSLQEGDDGRRYRQGRAGQGRPEDHRSSGGCRG